MSLDSTRPADTLTDTQLRATAVPVSNASLPLPTGASTEATLALIKAKTDNIDVLVSTRTKPADQQHVIVDSSSSVAVTGALTDSELRATAVPISAASLPLPTGASTAAKQPALGTAGTASADVISVQGIASMTALKVDGSAVTQPVSGTVTTSPPANASTNVAQVAGTATDVNSGNKSAGTIRVVLATDQPALTNKLLVTPDSVALPANQSVNISQINAVTPLMGNGVTGTGSPRVTIASDNTPFPVYLDEKSTITYKGRVSTFRTPGRAGTAGQKIFAIHNASGSTKIVTVRKLTVDLAVTVVKAVTVLPPAIRAYRVTVLPTNGTAGTKVARDSALSSNASVTVFQDASADGTSSASALTATLPAGNVITQTFAPRLITAAGYEPFDRETFLDGDSSITLRALEGLVLMLDYPLATQNPITDMWLVSCEWDEV